MQTIDPPTQGEYANVYCHLALINLFFAVITTGVFSTHSMLLSSSFAQKSFSTKDLLSPSFFLTLF
jgi:hypothetical protein